MDPAILARGLNREIALEKGIEYFYEMLILSCILGFSTYEIYKSEYEAEEKLVVHLYTRRTWTQNYKTSR